MSDRPLRPSKEPAMNGTSGLQEVRSTSSRSSTDRFLREQRHQYEEVSGTLLPYRELPRMTPQVRMKTPLPPASQNGIATLIAKSITRETFSSIFSGTTHPWAGQIE